MSGSAWANRARLWIVAQPSGAPVNVDELYNAIGEPLEDELRAGLVGGVIRGALASGLIRRDMFGHYPERLSLIHI